MDRGWLVVRVRGRVVWVLWARAPGLLRSAARVSSGRGVQRDFWCEREPCGDRCGWGRRWRLVPAEFHVDAVAERGGARRD